MSGLVASIPWPAGADGSTALGAVAVLLFIVLLVRQELVRVGAGRLGPAQLRELRVILLPLLAAFVIIVGTRLADLR